MSTAAELPLARNACLPRLPVPPLMHTLQLYLRSTIPLASEAEFKATAMHVLAALSEEDTAPGSVVTLYELHRRLQQRAGHMHDRSWLIDWWNSAMYTAFREPLPINVSYWYLLDSDIFRAVDAAAAATIPASAHRAAALILAAARFRDLVFADSIPAETASDGAPLDTSMYRYIFHACRVPLRGDDGVRVYDGEGACAPSETVTVTRNGRLFLVDLCEGPVSSRRTRVRPAVLAQRLANVMRAGDASPRAPGVPLLTAGHRDAWADAFVELVGPHAPHGRASHGVHIPSVASRDVTLHDMDPDAAHNLRIITAIESSMCGLVLSRERVGADVAAASRLLLHGNASGDVWYDKAANFVCTDDGVCGFIGEHSHSDGAPTANMIAWVTAHVRSGGTRLANDTDGARVLGMAETVAAGNRVQPMEAVTALTFRVSPRVAAAITAAVAPARAAADGHELLVVSAPYGARVAKAAGVSPDAWAQMAIQLAYFRTYGKLTGTYEPAQTRRFLCGRTACIRVLSPAAASWVASMGDAGADAHVRLRALQAASAAHVAYTRAASQGMDADRHLLGLRLLTTDALAAGERVSPSVLALTGDPVFTRSRTWNISTSNLTVKDVINWGWGEVVPAGLGIAYSTHADVFRYNIVAEVTSRAPAFAAALRVALGDMQATAAAAAAAKK